MKALEGSHGPYFQDTVCLQGERADQQVGPLPLPHHLGVVFFPMKSAGLRDLTLKYSAEDDAQRGTIVTRTPTR